MSWRQPLALTSTPYLRAAVRMRRHAASRSLSLTPSTWSKRAIALRTWRASLSGSLRSLGNANVWAGIRFFCFTLRPGDFVCFCVAMTSLLCRSRSGLYVRVVMTFYVIAATARWLGGPQLGLAMARVGPAAVPVGLGRNLVRVPAPVQERGLQRRHQRDLAGKKVPFGVVDECDLATRSDRVDRNAGSNGLRPSHSRAIAVHQDVDRQRGALAVKPADGIAPAHAGAVVFREGERDILSWQVLEPRQCRTAELDPPHPRRDTVGGGDGQLPAGRLRQGHGLVLPKPVR